MDASAIAAERLLADPGREAARRDVVLKIEGGRIAGVARDESGAGRGLLAMPALADAHDHSRGLSPILFGAPDQALELWLPALFGHPPVDIYATAAFAFCRLARAGFSAAAHFHVPAGMDTLADDAAAVARAAREVGLRACFIVPLRDRNRLVLGDNDAFLAAMPQADREAISARWLPKLPALAEQIAVVEEIARRLRGPMFDVQYGPTSPVWCSDALIRAIAEASAASGRRIHTHLFETRYQREWADAAYGGAFVRRLDELGFLSPRLTIAHGVWLRPDEMALLAERGVTVAVNSSSNLRLRSGIAPVKDFIAAGLEFAMGVDGLGFDDDDDGLRELRLLHRLHAGHGLEEVLSKERLFRAALKTGHRVIGGEAAPRGRLADGEAADIVVLDYAALTRGGYPAAIDEADLILTRATARHVRRLIVAGRVVVEDGRVLGVDEAGLAREIEAQAAHGAERHAAFAPLLRRFHERLRAYYLAGGHKLEPRG